MSKVPAGSSFSCAATAGFPPRDRVSRALSSPFQHDPGSADPSAAVSAFRPVNGVTLNLTGGMELTDSLSLQRNYVWNRNSLTLTSTILSDEGPSFYDQARKSSRHTLQSLNSGRQVKTPDGSEGEQASRTGLNAPQFSFRETESGNAKPWPGPIRAMSSGQSEGHMLV